MTSVPLRIPARLPAFTVLLALAACQEKKAEAPPPVRPVLVTKVEVRTAETFGPFAGTVEPRYQTQAGFRVPGRMVARDVYVGDLVPKGARLAALDPTVLQFAVTRARADVTDVEAQLANVSAVEARQRTLYEGGNVTQAALDAAVASRDTAAARLAQARAALQKATDELGYATLKADVDGVVTAWNAEIGQVVSAGQAVVTLARPDIREAVVDIPDGLMVGIKAGTAFTVTLQAAPTITATGRVREIGPLADPATRTRRVRMTLVDPPEAFRLGTTITVALDRATPPHITLPATALLRAEDRTSVWVVAPDGQSVSRRDVTVVPPADTPAPDEASVTLSGGVTAGETVVVAGVHSLKDGQAVRLAASGL